MTWLVSGEVVRTYLDVGSATNLKVPDSSIDYVFTDPPFGSSIYYSELNLIWEAWLGNTTGTKNGVHRASDGGAKRIFDYSSLMAEAFGGGHRVLKPGRWASVVFHNSDDQIWQAIQDAADNAGFKLVEINAFDKEQVTFKGWKKGWRWSRTEVSPRPSKTCTGSGS